MDMNDGVGEIRFRPPPHRAARNPIKKTAAVAPSQATVAEDALRRVVDTTPALIHTGTTGRPRGVAVTHANILENAYHTNFWLPYCEDSVHLHAAPIFHIADFPIMFAAPAFGACQVTIPKFRPEAFCEVVQRERVTHTVLAPTMINLLTQFRELQSYDLSTLRHLGYGGSPMAPELVHRIRKVCPTLNSFRSMD
jgi:acyl-coenzyme A synthetase/AMP-(fatty) acid ligase